MVANHLRQPGRAAFVEKEGGRDHDQRRRRFGKTWSSRINVALDSIILPATVATTNAVVPRNKKRIS